MKLLALLALTALAQDAPPSSADPEQGEAREGTSEEVMIYSEVRVRQARQKVEDALKENGYGKVIERDGRTIYRHDAPYMGQMVIDEDGWMVFERQPVRFIAPALPFADENSAVAWAGCIIWSFACVRPGGQIVSRRRFRGYEREVVGQVHDDVQAWAERISDLATERKLERLPESFEALWREGTPLEGDGPPLATHAERRRALFAYWDSRTETVWGEQVREAVVAFCRAVVQHSDHPFGDAELLALNADRRSLRSFDLRSRPTSDPLDPGDPVDRRPTDGEDLEPIPVPAPR